MVKDLTLQAEDPDYQNSVDSHDTVSAPAQLQSTGQLLEIGEKAAASVTRSRSGNDLISPGDRALLMLQGQGKGKGKDSRPLARRPLGGNSKKVLLDRINLLQDQIVTLQQRITDLSKNTSSPLRGKSIKADDLLSEEEAAGEERKSSSSQQREALQLGSTTSSKSRSDGPVLFPSTFASTSYDDPNNTESEYLEQVVTLAGKLRKQLIEAALQGQSGKSSKSSTRDQKDENDEKSDRNDDNEDIAFGTDELRRMLMEATPQPENAQSYASAFAQRNLELYKEPNDRHAIMRPGPLQSKTKHPRYVDILTKCIRESYIAHMGTFDELEFCVWLVTEVTYHTEQTGYETGDLDELDDTRYEFSEKFMRRYPFVGTQQLIGHANIWREKRGEPPVIQTPEMEKAERFTSAQQDMSREGTYPNTSESQVNRKASESSPL